ncbi:MAG: polysaccharide deacetylase family protein, partial [Wolbachia sp.]
LVERVLSDVHNGAVILFHDHNNRSNTIEALPHIIKILKKSGYKFVTLSEWERRVCNVVKARSMSLEEGGKVHFKGILCGQKTKSLTAEHSY